MTTFKVSWEDSGDPVAPVAVRETYYLGEVAAESISEAIAIAKRMFVPPDTGRSGAWVLKLAED